MRAFGAALVLALAVAAATAAGAGATNECHGIQRCIPVAGPWVVVPAHSTAEFLLTCPQGVVGGLDAQVTSRGVHVSFEGRLGSPVGPGTTTTRYAFFRAVSSSPSPQSFQPRIGCVPTQGGGGRSTVSARVSPPGPALEYRARVVAIGPSQVRFAHVACQPNEALVGAWHAIAFRTKQPPQLRNVSLVQATHRVAGTRVVVTASSTDALTVAAHALVQVGAECGP